MITRVLAALALTVSMVLLSLAHAVHQGAQQGDQFLDGIGETGLIARYVLNGNAEDSSRNQFHAALRGNGGTFVEDAPPRRVLLLTGDGSHLELPGDALAGEDAISVTAWLFLPTGASGHVFDFGQSASTRLFAEATRAGFRAAIAEGGVVRGETTPRPVLENQWMHVAVVLDPASRLFTTYVDGARAAQATGVSVNATQIVSRTSGAPNRLFLGRSQVDGEPTLHGRLRDVRIYRIALTDQQVSVIRTNGLPGPQTTGRRGAPPPVISTDAIPRESPWRPGCRTFPTSRSKPTSAWGRDCPRRSRPCTAECLLRPPLRVLPYGSSGRHPPTTASSGRPVRTRSPARCRGRGSSRRRR